MTGAGEGRSGRAGNRRLGPGAAEIGRVTPGDGTVRCA